VAAGTVTQLVTFHRGLGGRMAGGPEAVTDKPVRMRTERTGVMASAPLTVRISLNDRQPLAMAGISNLWKS
jgi:hypothetical protein